MTVAPQYPLQHSHLGDDNPEELIPSRFGVMERWRVNAMLTGELSGLTALRDRVKNDAVAVVDEIEQRERVVAEREARCDQRERQIADAAARLSGAIDRSAAEWDRVQQARADQEREAEKPAKPPGGAPDAALPGDPAEPRKPDDLHANSGDYPDLPAKGEPDAEAGDPPPSVPLSYVHSRDQAEFPDPTLAKPPTAPPPIAAGLIKE